MEIYHFYLKVIIEEASENLRRSPIGDSCILPKDFCLSQSTYLSESECESAWSLSQRIEHFLDLSAFPPESAEYQVINYGPAGQYNSHYDQIITEHLNNSYESERDPYGGRVASVSKSAQSKSLLYLP